MTEKDLHRGEVYDSIKNGLVILRDQGIFDGIFSYHFFSLEFNSHLYWTSKQLPSKLKNFELEAQSKKSWVQKNNFSKKIEL